MNPYGPRRGPRSIFWLLPLLVGVGLGALFFGGGPRGGQRFERQAWGRSESVPAQPAQPAQPAVPAQPAQPAQPQAAPQPPDPRFEGRGPHFRHEFDRRDHDWGFFPFGGMRLLIPLLLIGTGAWLLFGRRGPRNHSGPGGWGGPGGSGPQPAGWGGPGANFGQYGPGPQPAQPGVAPQPGQPAAPPPAGPYSAPPTPPVPPTPTDPPSTGETRIL